MGIEKREYPRLEQEFAVFFDVVPNNTEKPIPKPQRKCIAKNISGGGLYLVSPKMRRGIIKRLLGHLNKMNLEFYLPDFQQKINALGEVRWAKDGLQWWNIFPRCWELGVRFLYIEPSDRDSIIKYVINRQIEDHLAKPR